jgi:hypothetical protein
MGNDSFKQTVKSELPKKVANRDKFPCSCTESNILGLGHTKSYFSLKFAAPMNRTARIKYDIPRTRHNAVRKMRKLLVPRAGKVGINIHVQGTS